MLSSSACRKSIFTPLCKFLELKKVLKTYDFKSAGHPSWVSRTHPFFPSKKFQGFIDGLRTKAKCFRPFFMH